MQNNYFSSNSWYLNQNLQHFLKSQSRQQPKTFETVQVHRGAGAERGDVALILGDDLAAKR